MTEADQGPDYIKESMSTRAVEALMSNYRDPQQAFLELIDNAVDNRMEGKSLRVRVRVAKNELSVTNLGGKGLDLEGLRNFFVWGYSQKVGQNTIGFYGVGGKAAMGYLGRSMEVVCSAAGSDIQYRVTDQNWESREEGQWKSYTPEVRRAESEEGIFRVRVSNLKREVNSQALIAKLSDIYRPLLLDGKVSITVNNQEVPALQMDYVEDDPGIRRQPFRVQTRLGDWIIGQVGVLKEGQRVKPGIRCYYGGRLIEDEMFFRLPNPSQLPQMSRFIGEVFLDFIPVTTNKNSFDRGSVEWTVASDALAIVLNPWQEKLAKLVIENRSPIESFEKDLARRAKKVLEHVFATTGLVTKKMLPEGQSQGRRPASPSENPRSRGGGGEGPGPKEGRTAPVLEATIGEIKRWGAMFAWEITSMGSIGRRSDVVYENGKPVLKINSDYPLYQANKKAGDPSLELYMAETGIMKICQIVTEGKSIEDYLELLDNLTRDCGLVYQRRIKEKPASSRGTIKFN